MSAEHPAAPPASDSRVFPGGQLAVAVTWPPAVAGRARESSATEL